MKAINPKGAGRKEKYTTEELMQVVDMYLLNRYRGKINASLVAEYAIQELGYHKDELRYYHFNQRKQVKEKIDNIQRERKRHYASEPLRMFQNIEIDSFVDKYKSNPLKLKDLLSQLQMGQFDMYNKIAKLDAENHRLKAQMKKYEADESNIITQINTLKRENSKLKELTSMQKKLINIENHIKGVNYIKEHSYMEGDLVSQYLLILKKCDVIKAEDFEIIDKDYKSETQEEGIVLKNNIVRIKDQVKISEEQIPKTREKHQDNYQNITMSEINKILDGD